jgi:hypothetical protein
MLTWKRKEREWMRGLEEGAVGTQGKIKNKKNEGGGKIGEDDVYGVNNEVCVDETLNNGSGLKRSIFSPADRNDLLELELPGA